NSSILTIITSAPYSLPSKDEIFIFSIKTYVSLKYKISYFVLFSESPNLHFTFSIFCKLPGIINDLLKFLKNTPSITMSIKKYGIASNLKNLSNFSLVKFRKKAIDVIIEKKRKVKFITANGKINISINDTESLKNIFLEK